MTQNSIDMEKFCFDNFVGLARFTSTVWTADGSIVYLGLAHGLCAEDLCLIFSLDKCDVMSRTLLKFSMGFATGKIHMHTNT